MVDKFPEILFWPQGSNSNWSQKEDLSSWTCIRTSLTAILVTLWVTVNTYLIARYERVNIWNFQFEKEIKSTKLLLEETRECKELPSDGSQNTAEEEDRSSSAQLPDCIGSQISDRAQVLLKQIMIVVPPERSETAETNEEESLVIIHSTRRTVFKGDHEPKKLVALKLCKAPPF